MLSVLISLTALCSLPSDVLQQHADRLVQAAQASAGLLLHHVWHHLRPDPDHPVQEPRHRRLPGLPAGRSHRRVPGGAWSCYTSYLLLDLATPPRAATPPTFY